MTQIFTGEGLGLHGSSLGLGSYGPKGVAALGQGGESVYVNAANGNLVLRQSDGFLADIGFGLDLFQTYNSRGEGNSAWCFNMQSRLEINGDTNKTGSSVTRIDEDGHGSLFKYDAKKQCYIKEGGGTEQLKFTQNSWVYREGNQKASYQYDQNGQLKGISDLDGHSYLFNYENNVLTNIIDTSGKQKISWSFKNGLLQDVITTSNGEVIHHLHYEYDEHNRLHKVSRDLGQGKTFWITYDYAGDSNLISDIKQSDGTKLHIEYDGQNRVKKLIDGEGRITNYEYLEGKTIVTNGLGDSWTYYYDDKNKLIGIDGPEQYHIRYNYDGNLLKSIVQGNHLWRFTYNDNGDCIRIEEPSGQITQRIFDLNHNLISETRYQAFDGNHHSIKPQTTRYIYDDKGHLIFTIAADGTVTERRYDEQGQLTSTRCYLRGVYKVDSLPENEQVNLQELKAWIAKQNPKDISLIDYHYDWRGQLSEEIHYGQIDDFGNGIAADALSIRSRYDAAGRLIEKSSIRDGKWNTTHYLYDDLGRLIQTIDSQNHSQRFEYDDAHQRIIQTDANGLQTLRIYDKSGLLLSVIRIDSSHNYGSITYKYNSAGQLIAETGIDGLTVYSFYDHQGRLKAQVSGSGQVTEYLYNDSGEIIQTHQYELLISTKGWLEHLPIYEKIKPSLSIHDRFIQSIYNEYDQLVYRIDSVGAVIAYEYDAEGRVLSSTAYANRLAHFNPAQLLTFTDIHLVSDSNDRSIYYYYGVSGLLEGKVDAEGFAISYHYNRLGQVIETCRYYNAAHKPITGDWLQDMPVINPRKDIHTYSLYDQRGLKVADIDAEGYLTEYRYNDAGLLMEQCAYEQALSRNTKIDETTSLDSIRPKAHNNDHHKYYEYNDLGLLTQEKNQSGLITSYAYDDIGHVITKTLLDEKTQAARQQRYRYDALGRVIQSLDELGSTLLTSGELTEEQIESIWQKHSMRFTYDNAGLLLTKTNALNQTISYFYDDSKNLRYSINADGAVTETTFNSFGQLEMTKRYSAYLKINIKEQNTTQISERLEFLKSDKFDEVTRFEYNTIGQLITTYKGTRGLVTTSYNSFGEVEFNTQKIDLNHNKITAFYYDKRGLLTKTIDDMEGLSKKTAIEYDSFGRINKQIDGRGNSTSYFYNKRGEQLEITNASNQSKTIMYDAFGRVLYETYFTGNAKSFTYDDQNNSLTITDASNNIIKTQYNSYGDKVSLTDANGHLTVYHYDEKGQVVRVDFPENTFKEYHYDETGLLVWQQDAGNHIIKYTYDAEQHVLSKIIDPEKLNITTEYQYDGLGRQLQITESNGCIKQFVYDDQNNLIQSCIDPNGLNLITKFAYDDRGFLLRQSEINKNGKDKITEYQWDSLGRQTGVVIDPDGLKLATKYQYDENNNLISITDANQHCTHYVYDVDNKCRYEINPRGIVTEHTYDTFGNEVKTVIYAKSIGALTNYNEVSLKNSIISDANDHYQFCMYDAEGRVLSKYDGLGYLTTYSYDNNGNLLNIRHYKNAVSLSELIKGNRPIPLERSSRLQYFAYDALNQLRFKCDNYGTLTESQYDKSGQLISSIKYKNRISINSSSSVTLESILQNLKTSEHDQITRYKYNNAGHLIMELSAQGIAKSYRYDSLGQLISSTIHANQPSIARNADISELQLIKSTQDRNNHFVYDVSGRELYRISSEGRVLERRYDSVGNVIAAINHSIKIHLGDFTQETIQKALTNDSQAKSTAYNYDAAGRLKSEVNALHEEIQYTYDAQGNVLSKTDVNKALWIYSYDEANQLIETLSPSTLLTTAKGQQKRSIITRNTYDSFGNIIKTVRDAEGLKQTLIYEYDANSHKTKTLYPDSKINNATNTASAQRQEIGKNLTEEIKYNAFGEVIASSDKAGNWKHFALNNLGQVIYSVDSQGGLTQYTYDVYGSVINKTLYANQIHLNKDSEFTIEAINDARTTSKYDRKESYSYNLDNQVIEVSRDQVRTYNPKTQNYFSLKPTTKTIYNAFGEVIKSSIQLNETEWANTFNYYDNDGNKTATIDAEGYLTTYEQNVFGEVDAITEYATVAGNWDLENYSKPQSSSKDRTVTFTYDALGQLTSKTLKQISYNRMSGKNSYESVVKDLTTTFTYDALGHLTSTTDPKGHTAYCYYNELGQLTAKVAPLTQEGRAATTYSYDSLGQLVETKKWAQGTIEANVEHFTLKGASNQDTSTHQEYDSYGLLISETDGLNHKVNYSYDANGNLARSWRELKQADGTILIQDKRYTYDSESHLLQTATYKSNGTLKTEDAHYNSFGELIAKGIDGHLTIHVDYDQSGRIWRSNTEGYYQIFVYDLVDHVTQVVTSTNRLRPEYGEKGVDLSKGKYEDIFYNKDVEVYDLQRQDNSYNALGHLLTQSKEFTEDDNITGFHLKKISQAQTVDRWGNMLTFTNAKGLLTTYEYNAFNQLVKQELPEIKVMDEHGVSRLLKPVNRYAYDELGYAIAMIDANGHLVSKEYDALGRMIKETDAKGNQRLKHYNLLEQLTAATNELGGVTTYIYDQANRLKSVTTPKTNQQYEYDEAGQLIKQKNGANDDTFFWYDSAGNQIKRRDARGHDTHYEFDDAGRKTKETNALGRSLSWTYDDDGRLKQHTDLGGHVTSYEYNTNGLLLEETSSSGKHIKYHYQGNGELIQFVDEGRKEYINYTYDDEGQVTSKESSKDGSLNDSWLRETDHYEYDALGRLVQVRRRNPADTDTRVPSKDRALLSVDYDYDAVGNIRHTQVRANYTGYERVDSEDYYVYDENNRMTVNKGQLVNGQIVMTANQGSTMSYDVAGNIEDAAKYEKGLLQNYHYQYNLDNQLEVIKLNNKILQTKIYDDAGRVNHESLFDDNGNVSQKNTMIYEKGLLFTQNTQNLGNVEVSKTTFKYDDVGNMIELNLHINGNRGTSGSDIKHHYSYALWEGYQQSVDEATQTPDRGPSTYGKSIRTYDVNGLLQDSIDQQSDSTGINNTTHYLNSSVEGIKAREDKDGQTSYLTVAGKTIGDLHLDKYGKQKLNIYGGFTPSGNLQKGEVLSKYMWKRENVLSTTNYFLDRKTETADGTLPEATQDNLGAYTLQAGDTLESIALQVYGDSSLWYLLADANGISNKNQQASNNGPLHIGQRINIPPAASGQHNTSKTHKVLDSNRMIGNTSATTPSPPAPPPLPKKHNQIFAKIVVGIIATVATVLTAGIAGALAGMGSVGGSIFSIGASVLGGGASLGVTLAGGFAAGFIGSLASQGIGKSLGLQQQGIDLQGALIAGLATAVTGGLLKGLNEVGVYKDLMQSANNLSINKFFSISSAATLMEQNAASQGVSLAIRKHQYFDWEQLGVAGVTGGILGSDAGKNINKSLNKIDKNTGILSGELSSLTSSASSAAMGTHFNATDVLTDNLGNTLGHAITDTGERNLQAKQESEQELINNDELYLTDNILDAIHPERSYEQLYQNYMARKLNGSEGYGDEPHPKSNDNLSSGKENNQSNIKTIDESIKDLSQNLWNEYGDKVLRYGPKLLGIYGKGDPIVESNAMDFLKIGASAALDFVPVIGQIKALSEVWYGQDSVTGYEVNRFISALALIPGAKLAGKSISWIGKTKSVEPGISLLKNNYVFKKTVDYSKNGGKFIYNRKAVLLKHGSNASAGGIASYFASVSTGDGNPWQALVIGAFVGFALGYKTPNGFLKTTLLGGAGGGAYSGIEQLFDKAEGEPITFSFTKCAIATAAGFIGSSLTYGMPLIPATIVSWGPETVINKLGDVYYEARIKKHSYGIL